MFSIQKIACSLALLHCLLSQINDWDVSAVTDMSEMFNFATEYNQPLNKWNVGKVTSMKALFASSSSQTKFNQNVSYDFNVSNSQKAQSRRQPTHQIISIMFADFLRSMTGMLVK
jgi:Mycoplasma protein of unknown function, DUF285